MRETKSTTERLFAAVFLLCGLLVFQGQRAAAQATLTVTRSDDRNNVCVPGDCSLREAVNAANASAADDLINFSAGLTNITLTDEIVINNAGTLTINGAGANILTINGKGANRIFHTNNSTLTISGLTLTDGNAASGRGGAIFAEGGSLTLDDVFITRNAATSGGGVYLSGTGSTHRIINSTFSSNSSDNGWRGAGIHIFGGTLIIVNSTISNNSGRGIFTEWNNMTLRNVTLTNNAGGGIYGGKLFYLDFGNTIIAGNTAGSGPEIYAECDLSCAAITSLGGNLVGDSPGDSTNTGSIAIPYQPTDIRDINPLLGALQNNGGTTPTFELLAGSPAIDKGLNALANASRLFNDQRGAGFPRFRDGSNDGIPTVDIGAFELQIGAIAGRTRFDFDGDQRADLAVFRPFNQTWYLNRSTEGFFTAQFGLAADKVVPADYNGDGKTDIGVFRDGTWYWLNSSNNQFNAIQFGLTGDIPQPADFTGDGRAELAVYRSGIWWTLDLTNYQTNAAQFGISTDQPVAADYDGDGRVDQAVYRGGEWHLNQSGQGYAVVQFGLPGDKPVIGDYDGDGKADLAVYRDGTWYLLQSSLGYTAFQWGLSTDIPASADFDGDGRTDAAVYRDGIWFIRQSSGGISVQQFGLTGDKPVPAAYLP